MNRNGRNWQEFSASEAARLRDILQSQEANRASDEHLSDEEFIALGMSNAPGDPLIALEQHLALCAECSNELSRIRNLNHVWNDAAEASRLEERISTSHAVGAIDGFMARFQTALNSLIPPKAAFAAGTGGESEAVEFVIVEAGWVVPELIGTIVRRNREHYARIRITDALHKPGFADRIVLLTIQDSGGSPPFLQRQLQVGVAVLLGTSIPLTERSAISAELLPSSENG